MGDVIEAKANERESKAIQITESTALTPMDMLSRAVANGASMEMVEKLMALHERWEKNQARKAFDEALSAARAEIPPIVKNRQVGFDSKKQGAARTDYRHEDLAEIARTVDPILSKYGLSYRWRTTSEPNEPITVTCIVSHRMGHSEENTLRAGRDDSGNKNSIQQVGSTITYLQRYTLKAALGLAASNDDDGKASSGPEETVTAEQIEKIKTRIVEVGADIPSFCKVMKVERVEDVRAKDFNQAMRGLQEVEDWAKSQAKKGAK